MFVDRVKLISFPTIGFTQPEIQIIYAFWRQTYKKGLLY
jgi:hypothetical protein